MSIKTASPTKDSSDKHHRANRMVKYLGVGLLLWPVFGAGVEITRNHVWVRRRVCRDQSSQLRRLLRYLQDRAQPLVRLRQLRLRNCHLPCLIPLLALAGWASRIPNVTGLTPSELKGDY